MSDPSGNQSTRDDNGIQRLNLLGEELPVRISESGVEAREAIELVERNIESLRENSSPPSNLQLALLCALNLAGELLELQRQSQQERLSNSTADQMRSLTERIENLLNEDEPSESSG